ncbi:ComEC/Rec2 family competence protein [Anaeromassilibacillus sp. 1001302B_160321_C8]|uniref:ComEC/Rec2 family competence protein n=1 Tax=Anaeromassilibacillus sp. 1001302B_160321_C8 TaxID=2787132 RepID=UPI001A9A9D05|nr:ComEC/Rec2 family competence protein [Anaeromassilibacillus sp. 1001302B_160321_C8]
MSKRPSRTARRVSSWLVVAAILIIASVSGIRLHWNDILSNATDAAVIPEGSTSVYFIDVGQGDCELIRTPDGQNILIDAGTNATGDKLVQYLEQLGVEQIDTLIATHPHEDHIGGMDEVVNAFPIGDVYLPKVADSQTPTTRTYERLLDAIADKGLSITPGRGGMTILDDDGIKLEFLAPNADSYADLNSYSIVAKLTCGQKSFLFTGDAESDSEEEMLHAGYDLRSDVLKCGHHGSSTSTSAAFLQAVQPTYAVISCGVDNDYGHPHRETLDKLNDAGVQIYRTDEQDTILAVCDGTDVTFQTGLGSLVK